MLVGLERLMTTHVPNAVDEAHLREHALYPGSKIKARSKQDVREVHAGEHARLHAQVYCQICPLATTTSLYIQNNQCVSI
jgi:hypothetical protein